VGIYRSVEAPVFDLAMHAQVDQITAKKGAGDLKALLYSGDIWEVR
jgi:2-oxoglutarate ferredoxin oxidoreductase subunit beta